MKLVLILAIAALAGCAATGVKVTDAQVSAFKPGEATESQVVAALGQPTNRMRLGDGSVMLMYSYAEYATRPATFIPIVGGLLGGSDVRSSAVSLRFGPDGKLIDTSSYSSATGTGVGAAAGKVETKPLDQPKQ